MDAEILREEMDDLQSHLEWVETERDNAQADLSLIIKACRAAGQERDRNAHPSMGDDIAAYISTIAANSGLAAKRFIEIQLSQARVAELRKALEAIKYVWIPEAGERCPACWVSSPYALSDHRDICPIKKALASDGTDYLKAQLAEVEEVLEVLMEVDGHVNPNIPLYATLSALITKLESKRKLLLEEMKC